MKYKIFVFIILFPAFARAQTVPNLDSIINELKSSWTLGVDSNSNTVDIGLYNKYKDLFDTSAVIDDDFNFRYIPGKMTGTYTILASPKEFDLYAHDVALEVSKLRIDSVSEPREILNTPDSIIFVIHRFVYAEKPGKYVLQDAGALAENIISNHPAIRFEKSHGNEKKSDKTAMKIYLEQQIQKYTDSLYKFYSTSEMRITLAYTADSMNALKIKRIQNISNTLTCINDIDNDAVLDTVDASPQEFGEITSHGRPDGDLDGVPDSADRCRGTYGSRDNMGCPDSYFTTNRQIQAFVGVQFSRPEINLPELNNLGYTDDNGKDAMDVLESKKGAIQNPASVNGIFAGGNYTFYFGKNAKKSGISVGINYTRFVAAFELTEPIVYTFKAFDGTDFYRRQINISNLKEEIAYNVINIPVQFDYRFKPFQATSWVINVKAGPSILLFNNTSDYNTTINFGGIYQIDTVTKNKTAYYDFFNRNSSYNVFLTSAGINQQNTNPGAASVFSQLSDNSKNYDFSFNKNYRDKQNLTLNTLAFNLSVDGQYKGKKDNQLALKFGVHFVYASIPAKKDKYIPINKTKDSFNSIYNSTAKSNYFAYGLNIGFAYSF